MADYFLQSRTRRGAAHAPEAVLYAVFAANTLLTVLGNPHYVYQSACRTPQAGYGSAHGMTEIQLKICLHKIFRENNYVQLLTLSTEFSTSKKLIYYAAYRTLWNKKATLQVEIHIFEKM